MNHNYQSPRPRKREMMKTYFSKKYEKALDSLLIADAAAAADSEQEPGKTLKKGMVQGIASSLFDASIERLKPEKKSAASDVENSTESSEDFWKDENFRQDSSVDNRLNSPEAIEESVERLDRRTKEHFLDIFVGKLINRVVSNRLPEREHFGELSEEEKRKSQTVSATKLTSNLKQLTPKMTGVFEFQDSIVRLLTWRNPSGTVTMLFILTLICYNPMYLLMLPLLYIMFGLMVPGYARRHPFRRMVYPYRRTYGKSLIKDVANGGPVAWHPVDSIREFDYNVQILDSDETIKQTDVNNGVEFVVSLRDLQNATTATLSLSKSVEKFIYGTAGFKDEIHSTKVFLKYVLSCVGIALLSRFVNWSFLISSIIWWSMISTHPKLKDKLSFNKKKTAKRDEESPSNADTGIKVILDESPEIKQVEIYEIYKQGITPRHWHFYKISGQVFDPLDKYRKLQQEPPGVMRLEDVLPPKTWSFDGNSEWEIDYNVKKWSSERGLSLDIEGDFLIDDAFKRRRLTRRVLRFASPAVKPPYKYKK